MKDVPGELYERPWVNFGHNRNEALQLAKGKADYVLFIDADEVLIFDKDFKLPLLEKDFYYITTHFSGTAYARVQLINNALNWKWAGVLHEAVESSEARTNGVLLGVINDVHTDGARSQDPEKYQKDIKILENGLRDEPNNTRYVFYLAQSYKDAGDYENALKYFRKRIEMGGWDEELFWSMLQTGILEQTLHASSEDFLNIFTKVYHYRPTRLEPLYYMANYYRTKEKYALGYLIASVGAKIPMSRDLLFVQKWMYDYGVLLELSICAYWIGKYEECAQISHRLLAIPNLHQNIRDCVERNLALANSKMVEVFGTNLPPTSATPN
jgi:tetratricopeptide (TPR) repeat protein